MEFPITTTEAKYIDTILHDDYRREPTPHLYQLVRGCVVSARLGYWTLADQHGRAVYGHA